MQRFYLSNNLISGEIPMSVGTKSGVLRIATRDATGDRYGGELQLAILGLNACRAVVRMASVRR